MMRQISIGQIENGWVVSSAEPQDNVLSLQPGQQPQLQMKNHYCSSVDEVKDYLTELMVIN
jgi:hypothetical protein